MKWSLLNWILCLVGSIFLIIGLPFAWVGSNLGQGADQVAALPVLNMARLNEGAVGQAGVLEGRLSERNPLQFQSFVTYIRREYQGKDCRTVVDDDDLDDDDYECRETWVEDERVTPPLWLDLADGRARVANADYEIENRSVSWQSSAFLVENETKSYEGFKIGSPVFVKGKIIEDGEGAALAAEFVYGGDRASYLRSQRTAAGIFYWLGLAFSLIGGLLILSQLGWLIASLFKRPLV